MKEDEYPLITVIVPVYNVEAYLEECISSLVNQTYTNLEILLIDDGSTDSSSKICDSWVKSDGRVHVFHQPNQGPAAARNTGLSNATGQLVSFIDSDDWLELDTYEVMVADLKRTQADIAIIGMTDVRGSQFIPQNTKSRYTVGTSEEALIYVNSSPLGEYPFLSLGMCNKLCKLSLFHGIQFPSYSHVEDAPVTYKILERVDKFVFNPDHKYYYRRHGKSRSNTTSVDLDTVTYFKSLYQHMAQHHPQAAPYVLYIYIGNLVRVYGASLVSPQAKKYKIFRRESANALRKYRPLILQYVNPSIVPIDKLTKLHWYILDKSPHLYNSLYPLTGTITRMRWAMLSKYPKLYGYIYNTYKLLKQQL